MVNWFNQLLFSWVIQICISGNMLKRFRTAIVYSSVLILLQCLATGVAFSQSKAVEESSPDIRLGEIRFQARESSPASSPLKMLMLEIQVEVLNRSRRATAPANSIKLFLISTETKYPGAAAGAEFNPGQQETTVSVPLPPGEGRILTFGFLLPEKIPDSITFEVQVNPPEGEKKAVTWESGKS